MLPLIVPAAVAVMFWFFGYWPFDRSYPYLPKYSDVRTKKSAPPPPVVKPVV